MPILDRYLARETLAAFAAIVLVLLAVLLTHRLARYLADVVAGEIAAGFIARLLGYKIIGYLTVLLPLALFLALIFALGRLARDAELTAFTAAGVGPGRLLRGLGWVVAPAVAGIAALALYTAPWADRAGYLALEQAEQQAGFADIAAGRFIVNEAAGGVLYVGEVGGGGRHLAQLFAYRTDGGRPEVLVAERAVRYADPATGADMLLLEAGTRYTGRPGEPDFQALSFVRQRIVLRPPDPPEVQYKRSSAALATLWGSSDPADQAELQWRLSVPLVALMLAGMAVPLAHSGPRQSRYSRLVIAVLIFIGYANLLNAAQLWLKRGSLAPALGLWWVHALAIGLAVWLWRRELKPARAR